MVKDFQPGGPQISSNKPQNVEQSCLNYTPKVVIANMVTRNKVKTMSTNLRS